MLQDVEKKNHFLNLNILKYGLKDIFTIFMLRIMKDDRNIFFNFDISKCLGK